MASSIWLPGLNNWFEPTGEFASGAKVYFFKGATGAPLTTYKDPAHLFPHAHPVVADSRGRFAVIYLPYETYRVRVETASGVVIFDASDIENAAPPTVVDSSSGLVITSSQIMTTGFTLWQPRTGIMEGWVRLEGGTIGSPSASPTPTERANDDCFDLYVWSYGQWDNTKAPVSGGRGANATEDWVAGKTLTLLDGHNKVGVGRSRSTAEPGQNGIQVVTTCSATGGLNTITVASALGLVEGEYCFIDGVPFGNILSISGTTVTMTENYTGATGAGKVFKASMFPDPEGAGSVGGTAYTVQTEAQMPSHSHTVSPAGTLGIIGGGVIAVSGGSYTAVEPLTIGNSGGSQAQTNMPLAITGTYYIKL